MMTRFDITFLGTGTSHGVPSIDCMMNDYATCPKGVCREAETDSLHRRTRCSIIISWDKYSILVDVSADFREQVLREKVRVIDAVLLTHAHADHINGIPDIRSYTRDKKLKIYGSGETLSRIRESFAYIFNPPEMLGGGIPQIDCITIDKPFELFGRTIVPVRVEHGSLKQVLGFRIGPFAYIPDVKTMPDESKHLLEGIDCLIIDALRDERPHSTHMILPESIELARELKVKKTYFTHLCHNIHYKLDAVKLDEGMMFAWDGLRIQIH